MISLSAFLIGILGSFKLWISDRLFPLTPVFNVLTKCSDLINYLIFFVFAACLIGLLIKFNRIVFLIFLILLIFLIFQDQNRLQPWVYFYSLILFPFLIRQNKIGRTILSVTRIVIIGLYFWSGVQKLNAYFLTEDFPQLLMDIFKSTDKEILEIGKWTSFLVPVTEICISVLLVFKNTRLIVFWLAFFVHILIIIIFSPLVLAHNYIIIPWNIAIIALNYVVFYKNNEPIVENTHWAVSVIITVLVGVMPIFNLIGWVDDSVAFNLYSSKSKLFYVAISEKYWNKVNPEYNSFLLRLPENMSGGHLIDVNKWSYTELNVPVNPEYRIFKNVSASFCKYNIPNSDLLFLMYRQPMKNENLTKWTCE